MDATSNRQESCLTTFSDASLSPSGGRSQAGYVIQLTHGKNPPHLIHWFSGREKIAAQSSAEAEILALALSYQATLNFQLLTSETLAISNPPVLRCDNQAVLTMLSNPSWRSRHISIRGEAVSSAMKDGLVVVTFVSTTNQLADPPTKPTGRQINMRFFPVWGLMEK